MSTKPEQQLKVGDWWYLPDQDKLVRRDDLGQVIETADLDNLCQKALNYFLLNAGRLVTRDELLNDVWGVRDVSDGRISRVIRVLRVALGDNSKEPLYIETIPKRGFRFVAPVTVVEQPLPEPEFTEPNGDTPTPTETLRFYPSQRWLIGAALSVVLLLSAVLLWWQQQQDQPETVPFARIQSLSSMGGSELHAALSADHKYLIYSHSVDREKDFSLILQDMRTMEKRILLADEHSGLNGPVWASSTEYAIFYQKLTANQQCEIRKLEFKADTIDIISDNLVTKCGNHSFAARLQLTPDQKFLIYPSREDRSGVTALMLYSLETNTVQQLTTPPPSGFGDYSVSLSPSGHQLVFLRDVARTHAQVWLMSLATRDQKLVYESSGFYPLMVGWSEDQSSILLPSSDNVLLGLELESAKLKTIAYTDSPIIEISSYVDDKFLVANGSYWQSSLWKVNNPLTNSGAFREKVELASGIDTILQINPNPDGPSAVLSGRSGKRQLWLYYPDGRQKQVGDFEILDRNTLPLFSPDGKKLLLRVGTKLWLLQDGKPATELQPSVTIATQLSWGADNESIYYTSINQGQSQVFKLNVNTGEVKLFSNALKYYQEAPDGSYSIQRRHGETHFELLRSDTDKVIPLKLIDGHSLISEALCLRNKSVYFYSKKSETHYEVFRYDVLTGQLNGTGVTQQLKAQRFNVSMDEKYIYLDDGSKGDIDVGYIQMDTKKS